VLYLDSSALVKCYVREKGSEAVLARLRSGERVYTSALSYFEVLPALARKVREGELELSAFQQARDNFQHDWLFSLSKIEVDVRLIGGLEELILKLPLRGADTVHLSAVLWLRDAGMLGLDIAGGDNVLDFGLADKKLRRAAEDCGLNVFDPETATGA